MIFLALLAAVVGAGVIYQLLGEYRDTKRFLPPGKLLAAGTCTMHFCEAGKGSPAVVLESGIAASSVSWSLVQPKIAEFTRVCSYDRAGLGWSRGSRVPRTASQCVSELRTLLVEAKIPPPYILVGHSFGGLLIRAYANLRPDDVAGLVFVDPVSLDHWAHCAPNEKRRLQAGVKLSRRGAWLARFGVVRAALALLVSGNRRFPKLIARASAGKGTKVLENLIAEVRKLPAELLPTIRSHWSCATAFYAMADHLESLPGNAQTALQMAIPPNIPFVVLSAATSTEAELAERDSWVRQRDHARHIRVEKSGHWLHLDRPDVVVSAVQDLSKAITSQT